MKETEIMKHAEKYLQAKWVTENPDGYDERDVVDAKRYCNAYLDGYNQALSTPDAAGQSEELPNRCPACGRTDEERLMMTSECGVSACPY